ncbi:hypothetical protein CAPTEDRAFT_196701 [Capitella teleta]|uniref:Uncharacterized protein n=1 Tax=Capitella teleta TaxID=283909 RepID=R7TMU4_CAPTE|nr:hypothetical protein CAPTEDRAFT_196701 [Capitella teleta]|eukprot:ELT92871.1 hypothetical protein CAPTEDRAFT_196701 [Capitella teleta]
MKGKRLKRQKRGLKQGMHMKYNGCWSLKQRIVSTRDKVYKLKYFINSFTEDVIKLTKFTSANEHRACIRSLFWNKKDRERLLTKAITDTIDLDVILCDFIVSFVFVLSLNKNNTFEKDYTRKLALFANKEANQRSKYQPLVNEISAETSEAGVIESYSIFRVHFGGADN